MAMPLRAAQSDSTDRPVFPFLVLTTCGEISCQEFTPAKSLAKTQEAPPRQSWFGTLPTKRQSADPANHGLASLMTRLGEELAFAETA
jgi:hypothetical protein